MRVTITLDLPGRWRREALRKTADHLFAAAWEDYPDRIESARKGGDSAYARYLTRRCNLLESLSYQFREEAKP